MERLNLRKPKPYDYTEEAGSIDPRKRFYCVSEGPTEESYLLGIRNNRGTLQIKNDVLIEVIHKEEGQETLSHPLQLMNACLYNMGRIDEMGKELPKEEWKDNCKWEEYDPKLDVVCIVFDRDYRDLDKHLEDIYEKCIEHSIRIVISNPNFELWLLMHFKNIRQYDKDMLLKNKKNLRYQLFKEASKNKKYLEILVSKQAKGYSKGSRLHFERFKLRVDLAIEQSELFEENYERLKTELGTAMGQLLKEMRL